MIKFCFKNHRIFYITQICILNISYKYFKTVYRQQFISYRCTNKMHVIRFENISSYRFLEKIDLHPFACPSQIQFFFLTRYKNTIWIKSFYLQSYSIIKIYQISMDLSFSSIFVPFHKNGTLSHPRKMIIRHF